MAYKAFIIANVHHGQHNFLTLQNSQMLIQIASITQNSFATDFEASNYTFVGEIYQVTLFVHSIV